MIIICHVGDIPEQNARGFEINGQKLIVAKKDGRIFVYRNRCPHTGINLDWQPNDFLSFDQQYLQCSTHGALFTIENGYCIMGPCKGRNLIPAPFTIMDGSIALNDVTTRKTE